MSGRWMMVVKMLLLPEVAPGVVCYMLAEQVSDKVMCLHR